MSSFFFYFLPLHLLLVRSHQTEKIVVKRLYNQGRNNVYDDIHEGGSQLP